MPYAAEILQARWREVAGFSLEFRSCESRVAATLEYEAGLPLSLYRGLSNSS